MYFVNLLYFLHTFVKKAPKNKNQNPTTQTPQKQQQKPPQPWIQTPDSWLL